jgi:hypothetical protein
LEINNSLVIREARSIFRVLNAVAALLPVPTQSWCAPLVIYIADLYIFERERIMYQGNKKKSSELLQQLLLLMLALHATFLFSLTKSACMECMKEQTAHSKFNASQLEYALNMKCAVYCYEIPGNCFLFF